MKDFSELLIVWYQENKRDLPWRKTKDPYKIWLSEIILQQTRVNQGMPYYHKFCEKFPTIRDLANSSEQEVLKTWQGLGYYSRARNLHHTANAIMDKHEGVFPEKYDSIIQLKGVGKYTAAAIASFAYGLPYACVDGNVQRVLSRFIALDEPVNTPIGIKKIEVTAHELMDKKQPALFNHAMMELGATVCTPNQPNCENCPLTMGCAAYDAKTIHLYPHKLKKLNVQKWFFTYFFITDGKRTFIQKRMKGIWQNMYEFPMVERQFLKVENMFPLIESMFEFNTSDIEISTDENVIHKLTHRTIEACFVKIFVKKLPNSKDEHIFEVKLKELTKSYPISQLINNFLIKNSYGK
jgi:A/G-specific adenine glycosylase